MAEELDLFAGNKDSLDLFQDQDLFAGQAEPKPFSMTPEAYQRPGMKTEQPVYVPPSRFGKGEYILPSQRKEDVKGLYQGAIAGVPGALTAVLNVPSQLYNTLASKVANEAAYREAIRKREVEGPYTGVDPKSLRDYENKKEVFTPYGPAPSGAAYPKAPTLPSSSDIATYQFGEATSPRQEAYRGIGSIASEIATGEGAIAGVSKLARGTKSLYDVLRGTESEAGIKSLASKLKSGEIEKSVVPQRGTTPQDLLNIKNEIAGADADLAGTSALDKIKANVDALQKQRQKIAAETYGTARSSMDSRTAAGDVFQESKPGKDVINYFKNKVTPVDGQIAVSEAEEREINGIMRDLVGKTEKVEPSAILSETGEPVTPGALKTNYSSPDVLRELLRRLRDRANGSISEGYGALSQQRAGEFADKLASSLGQWDGELAKADKIYKEQSELLHPTRTARGKAVTKREKYDMNEYAVDPKTVSSKFFNSRQGVEQFTDLVGGNKAAVEQEAEKYVLSQLKGKSPEAMRSWFNNAQNAGWLNYDTLPQTTARIAERIYALEYEGVAQPIAKVVADFNNGVIKAEDLPDKLRSAVSGKDFAEEPVKRLMSEIDAIEKSKDKTTAARKLAKDVAIYAGLPALGVAGVGTYYGR